MKSVLVIFAATLALSACANVTATSLRDCGDQTAADATFKPNSPFYNLSRGLPTYGVITAYDPYVGRFSLKTPNCAQRDQPQPSPPHAYDLNKVGEQPGGTLMVSGNSGACPKSRA